MFNPERSQSVIACDLGGTKLTAAVIDSQLCQHYAERREIAGLPYNEIIQTTINTIVALASEHPNIAGVGISVAGQVDERVGIVSHREIKRGEEERLIAALPVHKYLLADMIKDRIGLPVFIENDGNAAILAEWRAGVAQGKENVVCLTIGTYMGSGVVARGKIVRRRTSGPLLGGIIIPDTTNAQNLQYIGVMVGGHTIEELVAKARENVAKSTILELSNVSATLSAEAIAEQARAGDPDALGSFHTVASSLRIAVINAINEWDPEILVLAGGLMGASDLLLAGLSTFIEQWRLPGADDTGPEIKFARFGADAGKVGAAIWAFDNLGLPFTVCDTPENLNSHP